MRLVQRKFVTIGWHFDVYASRVRKKMMHVRKRKKNSFLTICFTTYAKGVRQLGRFFHSYFSAKNRLKHEILNFEALYLPRT